MIDINWSECLYVKVYQRDGAIFGMLTWEGQTLLLQLWRKVDREGYFELGPKLGAALPKLIGAPDKADVIAAGLQDCLDSGAMRIEGTRLLIPSFEPSQKATYSERLRKQQYRERTRDESVSTTTDCPKMSHPVPDCPMPSEVVRNNEEKMNEEENRKTPTVQSPTIQPDSKPQADASASAGFVLTTESQPEAPGSAKASKSTRKADPIPNIALGLLGELQAARKRCNPNIPNTDITAKGATDEIQRCLRDGLTVEQLRHVIAVWEAMVRADYSKWMKHFNSVSPFRKSNVHQYVQMPLETAKTGRTDPRKSDADLAREADNKAYFRELRDKLGAIEVPSVPNPPQLERDF